MTLMENLLNLFRVDAQVRGLTSRVKSAERFLAAQQSKLDAAVEQKNEAELRLRQLKAKMANVEVETGALNARIEKLRADLNAAATNKQYTALLTELNTLKHQKTELENGILADLEAVEALTKQMPDLAAQVEERTRHRDLAAQDLEQRRADVAERLAELERERAAAVAQVPAEALKVFEQMADTYDGEAMAQLEVIDLRSKEFACGACNMHVPLETYSVLRGKPDALVRCGSCRRILYLRTEAVALTKH